MNRQVFICCDPSKSVEPIRRYDGERAAGGFVCRESGPRFAATFSQAEGRRFVEELAAIFGGRARWGGDCLCEGAEGDA